MSFTFHRNGKRYKDQFTDHFLKSWFLILFLSASLLICLLFCRTTLFHFVKTNMDKVNTVPSIFPGNCRTILVKVKGGGEEGWKWTGNS